MLYFESLLLLCSSTGTAANVPKPEYDEMETLVTDEERCQNVYDVFEALRNAVQVEVVAEGSDETKHLHNERIRVLMEHGTAMASMARDVVGTATVKTASVQDAPAETAEDSSSSSVLWVMNKLSMSPPTK